MCSGQHWGHYHKCHIKVIQADAMKCWEVNDRKANDCEKWCIMDKSSEKYA